MTAQNRAQLYTYFQTGDFPNQAQFQNLIDSSLNIVDTSAQVISSDVSALRSLYVRGDFSVSGKCSAAAIYGTTLSISGAAGLSGITYPTSAGTNGQHLQTNGVSVANWSGTKSFLTGGTAATAVTAGTTIYFFTGSNAAENTMSTTMPACTARNLYIQANTNPGVGKNFVFVVRKNGVSTALTCTISGAASSSASDLTHSVSYSAGDVISIQVVTDSGSNSATFTFLLELDTPS